MSLIGTLGIEIVLDGDRVRDVLISQPKPAPLDRLLGGRSPAEAPTIVRTLFPLCGNAQAAACSAAIEQALGVEPDSATSRKRTLLVTAEALREHVGRIAVDWPVMLGESGDPAPFAAMHRIVRELQAAVGRDPGNHISDLGVAPLFATARAALSQLLFGDTDADFATIGVVTSIERWAGAGRTPAARLMKRLLGDKPSKITEAETGTPYARHRASGVVKAIAAAHGELAARIAARLVEAIGLLAVLESLAAGETPRSAISAGRITGPGSGRARVDVARGTLEHSTHLVDGRIVDYRIDAPTTAHFAPDGPADRALRRLDAAAGGVEWRARLTVLEFDPCVAHELRIS